MSKLTRFLKDSRGLTLAEMLVGITLLSITMGILGSALFRPWERRAASYRTGSRSMS